MRHRSIKPWRLAGAGVLAALLQAGCAGPKAAGQAAALPGKVTGHARDAAGQPAGGVTVQGGGQSAKTSPTGAYVLSNVPAGNVVVAAGKSGYATTVRGATVASSGTATLDVALAPVAVSTSIKQAVMATAQTVSDPRADGLGATVQFQPNCFMDVYGRPVTSQVLVELTTFVSTDAAFADLLPGPLVGYMAGWVAPAPIECYSALSLNLTDPSGSQVYVDPKKPVTLTFPVPPATDPHAPYETLWTLNGTAAYWEPKVSAVRDETVVPAVYRVQLASVRSRAADLYAYDPNQIGGMAVGIADTAQTPAATGSTQ